MKVKEESEKYGLKLNIQKTKIMASGPITSWQIDGDLGIATDVMGSHRPNHAGNSMVYCESLPLPSLCYSVISISPHSFWHQGLVLWKAIFPWTMECGVMVSR